MKNIFSILKLTFLMVILFAVIYPLAIYGIAQFAPNKGKGETISVNGKVVGYQKIGQKFDQSNYFWGRPSAVDYNAAGSGGSNKAASNPDYLALVQKRIDTFLIAHPYLKKLEIPADMVTASGSGLDPNISPEGALIQVKRVAEVRKLSEEKVKALVENKINKPTLAGTSTVNVLELNVALDELK
ncbi:K(+)-transporting ATPase subunit C [Flavobacterium psychrophilum]|uniref:K(+)-transporting ATPase subunit C n=1 Tax=Flavobacterium psychrophilum TaxID=96345 RepID=UPI000B7C4C2A|nr:K(+)-transporting ATPase subunit C [Flavobacterium psychrophilum]EKT4497824.1 K(+)-transporting ATPase subunit C [Flavobacterium psychrophilum]ELI6455233.1 K(+)-transporting ATPase subunit C [Flavobacterium psychrophilum]MBM4675750.1 K(+)-transporting ATPase subunit C [Flavobacterium psychrophilum]MCB5988235.1 K(+)-transporting ATPase subunit C [Flavobacterium psychrophilum]MCB5994832.1 K(+)-transporting ATPase subunit C [Flavobacterium psychrophilum]